MENQATFPLTKLPRELLEKIVRDAIPSRRVDIHKNHVAKYSDQYDNFRDVENLRLTCRFFNTIVERQLCQGFRLHHIRDTLAFTPARYLQQPDTRIERFDVKRDRLKIPNGKIFPASQWLQQVPVTSRRPTKGTNSWYKAYTKASTPIAYPVRYLMAVYNVEPRFYMSSLFPSFKINIPFWKFPNLRDAILSDRHWRPNLTIEGYNEYDESGKPKLRFLKPVIEPTLESIRSSRVYVPPWNFNGRWEMDGRHPIHRDRTIELEKLLKEPDFLSIKGYTTEGGLWAGFYYSTKTGVLWFSPLECGDVCEAFGVCTSRGDLDHRAYDRAPTFVARLWIDPPSHVVEKYDWVIVREAVDGDLPAVDQIAKTWTIVQLKLFDDLRHIWDQANPLRYDASEYTI